MHQKHCHVVIIVLPFLNINLLVFLYRTFSKSKSRCESDVNINWNSWPVSAWLCVLCCCHLTGWSDNCMIVPNKVDSECTSQKLIVGVNTLIITSVCKKSCQLYYISLVIILNYNFLLFIVFVMLLSFNDVNSLM